MTEYKGIGVNVVSSYFPRVCGIASFSEDTIEALDIYDEKIKQIKIHPIDKGSLKYRFPINKKHIINQLDSSSWEKAANMIIQRSQRRLEEGIKSVVLFQHEYGLDGNGRDNNYNLIMRMTKKQKIPNIVVLHTILKNPDSHQKNVIQEFGENCDKLVTITPSAQKILREIYNIRREKIVYIPHGIPEVDREISRNEVKEKFGLENKIVISTPGLISPNKGIGDGINGFAEFLNKVKEEDREDLVYLVAGQTHPEILKRDKSDLYRQELMQIAEKRELNPLEIKSIDEFNLSKNHKNKIIFLNTYLEDNFLVDLIRASDVGITPYKNPEQISSGILSYFIGMGIPCVSTKFTYAIDLFSDEKDIEEPKTLVDFNSPNQIADSLKYIFNNEEEISADFLKKGITMSWSVVGREMVKLFSELVTDKRDTLRRISFID